MVLHICEFHENWLIRPYFCYGQKWNYIYAWYEIFEVKNM